MIVTTFFGGFMKALAPVLMAAALSLFGTSSFAKSDLRIPMDTNEQTIDFGGNYPYTPFYTYPNIQTTDGLKSFPSGHAMMGFYFLVFIPIGDYYRSRALKLFGLITGLGFGILLSLTRLAQGGHYLSDTLFSAFIAWMTILLVSWLVFRKQRD